MEKYTIREVINKELLWRRDGKPHNKYNTIQHFLMWGSLKGERALKEGRKRAGWFITQKALDDFNAKYEKSNQ